MPSCSVVKLPGQRKITLTISTFHCHDLKIRVTSLFLQYLDNVIFTVKLNNSATFKITDFRESINSFSDCGHKPCRVYQRLLFRISYWDKYFKQMHMTRKSWQTFSHRERLRKVPSYLSKLPEWDFISCKKVYLYNKSCTGFIAWHPNTLLTKLYRICLIINTSQVVHSHCKWTLNKYKPRGKQLVPYLKVSVFSIYGKK